MAPPWQMTFEELDRMRNPPPPYTFKDLLADIDAKTVDTTYWNWCLHQDKGSPLVHLYIMGTGAEQMIHHFTAKEGVTAEQLEAYLKKRVGTERVLHGVG